MLNSLQFHWGLLCSILAALPIHAAPDSFPTLHQLAAGAQQVRLLPGQKEFVFTLYGVPGNLEQLKQVVQVMKAQHLGNGFDPGPAVRQRPSRCLIIWRRSVGR